MGDRKIPPLTPAHISSDGGLVVGVTKKTLPAAFQVPTEEDGGRQEVWVTRRPPVSDVGGWWQAECG